MARAKNDNLVNEFDRVCHCCQRHIHFERNKSVENVVFFDGLFYHEKCFKESAGFHRKCGGCSKDIIIEDADQEGILVFKNKYWHEDCFKKKYSDKPIFVENIPEYKEDAYVKIVGVFNGTYYGYDTLKNYQVEDWAQLKQIATKLKEITKELKMFGFAVFQLSDDSKFTDVFQLSSMNIASSKGIKHVTDTLTLGKMIEKSEYHKYQMICDTPGWGDPTISDLDLGKQYFAIKIDKNRAGSKDKIMLFEINLDYNTWINIGQLIQRQK